MQKPSACAHRLRRVVSLLARPLRPKLQAEGITAAKLSVIGQLRFVGPMTATELAVREGVKIQSLTRLLAELEESEWITRGAHPTDGRQIVLSLSPSGMALLKRAGEQVDASLAQVIAEQLTVEEQAQLLAACVLLERLAKSLITSPAQMAQTLPVR